MKKNILAIAVLLVTFLCASFVSADVVINEIMYNPTTEQGGDANVEWVELYNNGTNPVNIANWTIDGNNFDDYNITAGEYLIVVDKVTGTNSFEGWWGNNDSVWNSTDGNYSVINGTLSLDDNEDTFNTTNSTYSYIVHYLDDWGGDDNGKTLIWYNNNWTESAKINGTPGRTNDEFAPVLRWITPLANDTYITGIYNVTVNLTDATAVDAVLFNFNGTNFSMSYGGVKYSYLWNTSAFNESSYNITVYFNDTLGNSNSSIRYNITVDRSNPQIYGGNATANQYNYIAAGAVFNATVNATDSNQVKNVTCYLSGTTTGFSYNSGINYTCTLTAPSAENDYTITFTAIDGAGNTNTTTTNFTTIPTTTRTVSIESKSISVLNQTDYQTTINVTLANAGSVAMHSASISNGSIQSSFAAVLSATQSCGEISPGSSCTKTFNVTVRGGTAAGAYNIAWLSSWINNDLSPSNKTDSAAVTIANNPIIAVASNITNTTSHGTNSTFNTTINSTGNGALTNVGVSYTAGSLLSSWVIFSPTSISSVAAGSNAALNITVVVPQGASPGNYTGTFTITADSAASKTITLIVEVPTDNSWYAYPSRVNTFRKTNVAGNIGTVYINNTGNTDQTYTILYAGAVYDNSGLWNTLNPTSIAVSKQTVNSFNVQHLGNEWQTGSYDLNATVKVGTATNKTVMNLTLEDTAPFVSITSPLVNSYPNGTVKYNTTAADLNLSRIEYYIDNTLVYNDTAINFTFSWDSTIREDGVAPFKVIAYDSAGNYNTSEINVTVNNTDNAPLVVNALADFSFNEDTMNDSINLSRVFGTIDGDTLTYNATVNNTNLNVSIDQSTGIVNLTPAANWTGVALIVFNASDSARNFVTDNVVVAVNNVDDLPTAISQLYPTNGTIVYSAAGSLTLNWTDSVNVDADDTITYYLYFSTNASALSKITTSNSYYPLAGLTNGTKYYWRVNAYDGHNYTANTTTWSFNMTFDDAPVLYNYLPTSLTPTVAESSSLNFSVNATDPDLGPLNYTWTIDSNINKTDGNNFTYYPLFNATGTHYVRVNITDNNSNTIAQQWTVAVTNTNRAPALAAISNQSVVEDTILTFNITGADPDLDYGDVLTYSSNNSAITITKINNTLASVSWTPTNSYVGNNTISFTVSDGSSTDSKIIIIQVNNTNDAPVLTTIGSKTAYEGVAFSYDVNATDVDSGDSLTFKDNSTLFNISPSTGIISFTPTAAEIGVYKINISVNDTSGAEGSEAFTLTITNSNDAPVLNLISGQSVKEDSTLEFNITASDADLSYGDSLTYYSNNSAITITQINNTLAGVSWTPTNSYVGNHTVVFSVNDSSAATGSQQVSIQVNNTNDAPTIDSYYPTNLNPKIADNTESIIFNITKSDADGETPAVKWYRNGTQIGSTDSVTVSSLSAAAYYNITVIVNDSSGSMVEQEWNLTVSDVPITTYTGTITTLAEAELGNATDVTVEKSAYGSIDFGNNTLNLSDVVDLNSYVNISSGVVGIDTNKYPQLNKSAHIVMRGLAYTVTPIIYFNNNGFSVAGNSTCPGTICSNITYSPSSGVLEFDVAHFSTYWTGGANNPPVITSSPTTTAYINTAYSYDVAATDADNDALNYSLTTSPTGMAINGGTGLISWTPNTTIGSYNVTVAVTDSKDVTNQSYTLTVRELPKLALTDLDVKVGSKTDKNIEGKEEGYTIKEEAAPGSEVEFKLKIENTYTEDQDLKIEDIEVIITIDGVDNGDDLEKEADSFDLKAEKKETVTLAFDIPFEVDEGEYDVTIDIEGEDENGTRHEIEKNLKLEVKKENHEIIIQKAELNPSTLSCPRTSNLDITLMNIGSKDEEDVSLKVSSADLGIDIEESNIELEEDPDGDNSYDKLVKISVADDKEAGEYPISVKAYYDGKPSGSETVNLAVKDCPEIEEAVDVEVIPAPAVPKKEAVKEKLPSTLISFRESDEYMLVLALAFIILTGAAIFGVGALIAILKK